MKKLELRQMELNSLSEAESKEVNGGIFWLIPPLVAGLIVSAINNWGDIKQGIKDGWNGTPSH